MPSHNPSSSPPEQLVLLIESDQELAQITADSLRNNDLACQIMPSGSEALLLLASPLGPVADTSLVLCNPASLGMAFRDFIAHAHDYANLPVIIMADYKRQSECIQYLQEGSCDYVTTGCDPDELVARIRIHLRTSSDSPTSPTHFSRTLRCGSWSIEPMERRFWVGDLPINLTRTELALVYFLMKHFGHIVSRADILHAVYGPECVRGPSTIDTHVGNIRKKLGSSSSDLTIETCRSAGFMLRARR